MNKGFSLIEAMVTMLIATVGMLALGSFYLASMDAESRSQQRVAAVHFAEQILEDWQNTNVVPTPDCKVGGVATGILVLSTLRSDCVPTSGLPIPFDVLVAEMPVKAPIPNGHSLHSTGAGAPEWGELLINPAATLTAVTKPTAPRVNVRSVRVSWEFKEIPESILLTHITRKP